MTGETYEIIGAACAVLALLALALWLNLPQEKP